MKNNKLNVVLIVLSVLVFVLLFLAKDKLTCFVTSYQLKNNDVVINKSDSIEFFKQFNNSKNTYRYNLSLIELGGFGCKPCMKMDTVLQEVKTSYKDKINIKTFRVTSDEGKIIAKYFGVNAIPTQIIIDKNGNEVFRHTGFLSKNDLETQIIKIMNTK